MYVLVSSPYTAAKIRDYLLQNTNDVIRDVYMIYTVERHNISSEILLTSPTRPQWNSSRAYHNSHSKSEPPLQSKSTISELDGFVSVNGLT